MRKTIRSIGGLYAGTIGSAAQRTGDGEMEERTAKYFYSYTIGALMAIFLLGTMYQDIKREEITITHTVRRGETLWEISEKYITPDRYMPEFVEGIYELNYEQVFAKREKNGAPRKSVYPGDELEIHYWQTPKEDD